MFLTTNPLFQVPIFVMKKSPQKSTRIKQMEQKVQGDKPKLNKNNGTLKFSGKVNMHGIQTTKGPFLHIMNLAIHFSIKLYL